MPLFFWSWERFSITLLVESLHFRRTLPVSEQLPITSDTCLGLFKCCRRMQGNTLRRAFSLPAILPLPVVGDCDGHSREPTTVFAVFDKVGGGEELDAVGRGIAEGLEQPRGDEDGHVMHLTSEHPGGLLRREPRGELSCH